MAVARNFPAGLRGVQCHSGVASAKPDPVFTTRQHIEALVVEAVDPRETTVIRLHLQCQHIYGPDRFRKAIEAQLGRPVGPKKIGRPRKLEPAQPDLSENRL